jgi:hypothetical protein
MTGAGEHRNTNIAIIEAGYPVNVMISRNKDKQTQPFPLAFISGMNSVKGVTVGL